MPKPGNVGPQVDPAETTVVVEFNDLEGVRRALARRDIACVLTEPALTNIGIVLPEPGFLDGLEQACRETGTLLVYDETHTISAGPGGCVAAWGLSPDIVTIGKSLGAGVPVAAYGVSQAVLERSRPTTRATTSTGAASAARSPAMRCRSLPRARRSPRC